MKRDDKSMNSQIKNDFYGKIKEENRCFYEDEQNILAKMMNLSQYNEVLESDEED